MPDTARPDPDVLLARVNEAAAKEKRGRLKIFFGAAPGVGKTYAMLRAAAAQRAAGVDVVAGVVETHQRSDTKALLDGLEALPRRRVAHRGITIDEFDLDGALARNPELLLVDELAHTNAHGSRHAKRWQDVIELIDAGIDVYSTLNVQHLDALNDIVAQVTGVTVRETIPDSVFDQADDIELIDLPADDLLVRLQQGKVYVPTQADLAKDGFFRPGNLNALRELALRRTADRVDAQMQSYREEHSIASTWPVTGRLMVSIGPSPYSAKLIRAAKRMADRLRAEWIVAFVETPAFREQPEEVRGRVLAALRLAAQLGAETVTLTGANVGETLVRFARSRNVSRLVIGKHAGPIWRRLWRGSVLDDLIGNSGDIEVTAISGEAEPRVSGASPIWSSGKRGNRDYWMPLAAVAVATAISMPLRPSLHPVNLVMIYLLAVILVAARSSRRMAMAASFLSVAAFDFFCVPPYLTFAVSDYEYLVTFAVMLTVALLISTLTVRIRQQADQAVERETRTNALYRLTKDLTATAHWFEAARTATATASEILGAKVVLFFPESNGQISFARRTTDDLPVPKSESGIAQWAFDHAQKAGRGMDTLPGATALYVPLKGAGQPVGVMAVVPGESGFDSPEKHDVIDTLAAQTALAIERSRAASALHDAQVNVETERMRSGLLSAVSHDLRTPLATITGAAGTLQNAALESETRLELSASILREAERLDRLVANLLEMTRLESGAVQLKKEWHSVEEIAGAALARLEKQLEGRTVAIQFPPGLPLVLADGLLLEQLLLNLLDNAAKHTPAGSPIAIAAEAENEGVAIAIADSGPGLADGEESLIWEKFYRGGNVAGHGAGLGLAICHAIVSAHNGSIRAENRPAGGAAFHVWLPTGGTPPKAPAGV